MAITQIVSFERFKSLSGTLVPGNPQFFGDTLPFENVYNAGDGCRWGFETDVSDGRIWFQGAYSARGISNYAHQRRPSLILNPVDLFGEKYLEESEPGKYKYQRFVFGFRFRVTRGGGSTARPIVSFHDRSTFRQLITTEKTTGGMTVYIEVVIDFEQGLMKVFYNGRQSPDYPDVPLLGNPRNTLTLYIGRPYLNTISSSYDFECGIRDWYAMVDTSAYEQQTPSEPLGPISTGSLTLTSLSDNPAWTQSENPLVDLSLPVMDNSRPNALITDPLGSPLEVGVESTIESNQDIVALQYSTFASAADATLVNLNTQLVLDGNVSERRRFALNTAPALGRNAFRSLVFHSLPGDRQLNSSNLNQTQLRLWSTRPGES